MVATRAADGGSSPGHVPTPQRPTGARTGRGARDELHGHAPEDALPQANGARYFAMDAGEDVGEAPAAGRPAPLLEVLPQERVQQRTAEQIVDPVPVVPLLHVFVPQMVEQLVDILAPLDFRVAEQVIEVPKIVCPPALLAQFSVRRRRQTSWWKCRRLPPILRYCSGLWSRTLPFQFLLVVEGETQIFKVFSEDRVQQRCFRLWNAFLSRLWSRPLTFLLLVEVLQIFAQDRVHPQLRTLQLLGLTLRMSWFNGFFRTFSPEEKSANVTRHLGARVPRHVSSSTSSAYGPRTWVDDDTGEVWTLLTDPALGSWWYCSRTRRSQWDPPWER